MMTKQEMRWMELQFYFLLRDLWNLRNNFQDILSFTKCIKLFGSFDESRICSLAQDTLMNGRLRMNVDEYLILSWINHVPLRAIQKYKKIHKIQLGRAIKHYMENPDEYYFYPRNTEADVQEIKNFLDAIESMKGVGVTWTNKFTKRCGHYSNRSEPKLSL